MHDPAETDRTPSARGPSPHPPRRILVALVVAPFFGSLTFAAPAPFFPDMARDLGVSIPLLGQVVTAMLLLSALLALLAGPLGDRYGHRRLLVLGALAAAGCLLCFGLAPTYPVLLAAGLLGGLAGATLPPLSLAVAGTVFAGEARRRAIGLTIASLAGAAVIGVPALAALGDVAGWRVAFLGAGLLALGAAALLGVALPRAAPAQSQPLRLATFLAAYRPLLAQGPTRRLYGSTVLRAVCWLGLLTYVGAFLGEELGLDTMWVGVSYMLGGGGYVIGSLSASRLLGRAPMRPLVAAMTVGMALTMAAIFTSPLGTGAAVALFPLAGFIGAVGWVGMTTILTEETPGGAGATMALNGALFDLGAAGGGAIGGALLAAGGYQVLGLGLPLFGIAAALLVWRPRRTVATRLAPETSAS